MYSIEPVIVRTERKLQCFFETNTTGDVYSVMAGLATSVFCILSDFLRFSSLCLGLVRYDAEYMSRASEDLEQFGAILPYFVGDAGPTYTRTCSSFPGMDTCGPLIFFGELDGLSAMLFS